MRLLMAAVVLVQWIYVQAADPPPPVPLRSYRDDSYAVGVSFGTPAQTLNLAVDLFGTDVTVAGVQCVDCCHKTAYDASKSTTNKNSCKAAADGKTSQCQDQVSIGSLSFGQASFTEVISTAKDSAFATAPSDGSIGLGNSQFPAGDSKIFGFWLQRSCNNDAQDKAGSMNIADWDKTNCDATKIAAVLPLTANDKGNPLLSAALTAFTFDTNLAVPSTTWRATFTTTSADLVVPKATFDKLNGKYWNAKPDTNGNYLLDCSKVDGTKVIQFTFTGTDGKAVALSAPLNQFLTKVTGQQCHLRIRPRTDDDANYWVFGLPLLRQYCTLFDFQTTPNQVSFAAPKVTPAPSDCTYNAPAAVTPCETQTTPTSTPASHNTTPTKGAAAGAYASVFGLFAAILLAVLF